jgi:hypothetical protein
MPATSMWRGWSATAYKPFLDHVTKRPPRPDRRTPHAVHNATGPGKCPPTRLLQLFFGWFGRGRFYVGPIGIVVIQLILGLMGLIILIPLSVRVFIGAILMFTGTVRDSDCHPLRWRISQRSPTATS